METYLGKFAKVLRYSFDDDEDCVHRPAIGSIQKIKGIGRGNYIVLDCEDEAGHFPWDIFSEDIQLLNKNVYKQNKDIKPV